MRLAAAAFAVALGLCSFARATPPEENWGPLAAPPAVERLENGLTLVTAPFPAAGIVSYFTLVRVGARDEVEPGLSGFAHLFEHLMFRGTVRFPEDAYERAMQSLGADGNAYTTRDYTLYTITAPSEALPTLVDLEADRFQHLSYAEPQFRAEAGAVLGEYHKSASSPELRMWEALNALAFRVHPYRHTTLGALADIRAMPQHYAHAQAFFRRFYTPDATTLIVAGDFDRGHLVEQVRAHYAGWQGTRDPNPVPTEPAPPAGGRQDLAWPGSSEPRVLIGYRTPAFGAVGDEGVARDAAALEVLRALAFGETSPLHRAWVLEARRALSLGSWGEDFHRDPGLFVVEARLAEAASLDALVGAVQAAVDTLAREVDPEALARVRSHLTYATSMDVQTPEDAAEMLAYFAAVSGAAQGLPAYLAALAAVSAEDVRRVAARYLTPQRRFVVTLTGEADE